MHAFSIALRGFIFLNVLYFIFRKVLLCFIVSYVYSAIFSNIFDYSYAWTMNPVSNCCHTILSVRKTVEASYL